MNDALLDRLIRTIPTRALHLLGLEGADDYLSDAVSSENGFAVCPADDEEVPVALEDGEDVRSTCGRTTITVGQ